MILSNEDISNIKEYYKNNKMPSHQINNLKKFILVLLSLFFMDLIMYFISYKQLGEIYSDNKIIYIILIVITAIFSVLKYILYFYSIKMNNVDKYKLFLSSLLIQMGILINDMGLINSEHNIINEKLINIQLLLTAISILYLIIRSINLTIMIKKGMETRIKKITKYELIVIAVVVAISIIFLPSKYGKHLSIFGDELASFAMGCFFWCISCLMFCFAAQCLVRFYYYHILDLD